MPCKNALYAQSGGVTAVINASAAGLIQTAQAYPEKIGKVFAAKNGIVGALSELLIDTSLEPQENIEALTYTPAGAFGSCRYKLKGDEKEYARLIEVLRAHDIGYFFYNGGGDSQDTAHKVSMMSEKMGYPVVAIGIPKTIDNDLPFTDCCPGFGSVAKYIAVSTMEAGLDVQSMAASSTKVFVFEVMGRHAGWIAASAGLANRAHGEPPHVILFPEIPFHEQHFLSRVQEAVSTFGYAVVVVSEGIRNSEGRFLSEGALSDAFGHVQLGGVAPIIANLVTTKLGFKHHWAVADYLQRSARHLASKTDLDHAYALGKAAVELAINGHNGIMPIIQRESDKPYRWSIGHTSLASVANQEKKMPRDFISEDGFGITEKCRTYLEPLIQGEAYPPYHQGLPCYVRLENHLVEKKLPPFEKG